MSARSLPVGAAAFAAAAAVLLTACGGSEGKPEDDKIAGAETGERKSASPSESSSDSAARPEINFPKGAGRNVFEETETGDPKKDAILADLAQGINAVDEAIFKGSLKTPALSFYNVDKALVVSSDYIQGYLDKGRSWVGTTRYSGWQVSPRNDGAVAVIYCSDESKSNVTDRKTGKIRKTPTTADSYVLYNARLKKSDSGVWQTVNVISERGANQCQP